MKIFAADPTIPASVADLEKHLNEFMQTRPKVKLTPLQSSAVTGDKVGEVSTIRAQHVYTITAEWEEGETAAPPATGSLSPGGHVRAQRTGRGPAYR
jgi:hypothetical protein